MSVSAEAGNRTGSKRECLPSESDYRRIVTGPATDYGPNRQSTDYGRVRGIGHSSTVLTPRTYRLCTVPGTSTAATVDYVGSK